MLVVIKEPNEEAKILNIKNDINNFNSIVKGEIKIPFISEDLEKNKIDIVINSNSEKMNLETNLFISSKDKIVDHISGNCIFVSHDKEGKMKELSLKQIDYIYKNGLNKMFIDKNKKKFCILST